MWSQRGPLGEFPPGKFQRRARALNGVERLEGGAGGRGWRPQARPMGHQGAHRPSRHPLLLAPTTPHQGYRQAERALPSSRKENRHIRGLSLRCLLLVPPTQSQSPPFPQVTSCPAILPADLTSPTLLLMQTFFLGFILDTSTCTPLGTE